MLVVFFVCVCGGGDDGCCGNGAVTALKDSISVIWPSPRVMGGRKEGEKVIHHPYPHLLLQAQAHIALLL